MTNDIRISKGSNHKIKRDPTAGKDKRLNKLIADIMSKEDTVETADDSSLDPCRYNRQFNFIKGRPGNPNFQTLILLFLMDLVKFIKMEFRCVKSLGQLVLLDMN